MGTWQESWPSITQAFDAYWTQIEWRIWESYNAEMTAITKVARDNIFDGSLVLARPGRN